jgi:hypothetical protein
VVVVVVGGGGGGSVIEAIPSRLTIIHMLELGGPNSREIPVFVSVPVAYEFVLG